MKCFLALFSFSAALVAVPAFSAAPRTLSYQGVLTDGSGNLVADGNYKITFRLYDAAVGGTLVWTEAHDGSGGNPPQVAVSKGGFSVILGGANTLPPFNAQLFLEIEVAPDPPISPRIQLTSAPYALNARNLYDGGSNNFVGVGRSMPVSAQEYFGVECPVSAGYGGMYVQTSSPGTKPFYGYSIAGANVVWHYVDASDGNKWKLHSSGADRVTVTTAGQLGIGTTSPGATLEVNGGSKLGSDAPTVKMKKLTGFTSTLQGFPVQLATGVPDNKILSVTVLVEYSPNLYVPPSNNGSGLEYLWYTTAGFVRVVNSASNSFNILNKPIKVLLTYEE